MHILLKGILCTSSHGKALLNICKPFLRRISFALRTHHWSQEKELQNYSYIQSPTHCILLWGPHYKNHRAVIHCYVFDYIFFYFILWFSCSFYFCDITFSFCFTLKAQGRKRSRPDLPEMLGKIFQIKTGVCNLFSVQFLTTKHNTLPSSQILCHISLDCTAPSTTNSNSITNQMMC